jgi:hypothetical protein
MQENFCVYKNIKELGFMEMPAKIIIVQEVYHHSCNPYNRNRILYKAHFLENQQLFYLWDDEYDYKNNKWYSKQYERFLINGNEIKTTENKVIINLLYSIYNKNFIKDKESIIRFQLAWNLIQ